MWAGLEKTLVLLEKALEEFLHEGMAPLCNAFAFRREHLVLDPAELDPVFTVARIVSAVGLGVFRHGGRVVQHCSHFAGEEIGPGDTDRANGVELVRIEETLRLQCLGNMAVSVSVGEDAVEDVVPLVLGEEISLKNFPGDLCTDLG